MTNTKGFMAGFMLGTGAVLLARAFSWKFIAGLGILMLIYGAVLFNSAMRDS